MAYELQNSLPDPVQAVNTQSDEEWDVGKPMAIQKQKYKPSSSNEFIIEVILRARYMKSEAKEVTKTGSKIIPGRWVSQTSRRVYIRSLDRKRLGVPD